jgi:hypothetical protein
MATREQTQVLATPTVMVGGTIWAIVPGSLKEEGGAPGKVRTVSNGGLGVSLVHGVDMKEAMTSIKFDIANTAENQERARTLHDDSTRGVGTTLLVVNDTKQRAYNDVYMVNKFVAEYSSEGNIPIELMGLYNP